MKHLKFIASPMGLGLGYTQGETGHFEDSQAEELIKLELAVLVEEVEELGEVEVEKAVKKVKTEKSSKIVQGYSIITEPTSEPITLAEAKLNLRVTNNLEDNLISALIVAARKWVENYSWRPLMTQTIQANFDKNDILTTEIWLNKYPIQSITSVKYIDTNGTEQTINSSTYEVDLLSQVGRIKLAEIPNMKDSLNAFKVRFVAGYTSAANVPANYKQAMYLIITSLYDNRNQVSTQNAIELPFGVYTLLNIDHNRYNRTISI